MSGATDGPRSSHRVGTAAVVEVTDLFDPGHRLQVAGPAVYPVNRVRCVRDEGREDRVQVDDALGEHVQRHRQVIWEWLWRSRCEWIGWRTVMADCVFQAAAAVMIWFQTAKRLVISVRHSGALIR